MIEDYKSTAPLIEPIFDLSQRGRESLRLHLRGTNFQIKVWEALLTIPAGAATTYERIATQIGKPSALRAVGTAVGHNPVAVLIPCHRVLRKDGDFGNYRYGSARKKALLAYEIRHCEERSSLLVVGDCFPKARNDGNWKIMKTKIWIALLALYIVWGSTYLAIQFAVETIPPFLSAGIRFLVSGIILVVWQRAAGTPMPTSQTVDFAVHHRQPAFTRRQRTGFVGRANHPFGHRGVDDRLNSDVPRCCRGVPPQRGKTKLAGHLGFVDRVLRHLHPCWPCRNFGKRTELESTGYRGLVNCLCFLEHRLRLQQTRGTAKVHADEHGRANADGQYRSVRGLTRNGRIDRMESRGCHIQVRAGIGVSHLCRVVDRVCVLWLAVCKTRQSRWWRPTRTSTQSWRYCSATGSRPSRWSRASGWRRRSSSGR